METNRRGFLSFLAGVVAWVKSPQIKSVSPTASAIHPTCCACGAVWHTTSGCPINNTAMGAVSMIRFDGVSPSRAAAWLELQCPTQRFAEYGGKCVFPIVSSKGIFSEDCIAYAIPHKFGGWVSGDPKYAHAVVSASFVG